MKTAKLLFSFALALFSCVNLQAQVLIGVTAACQGQYQWYSNNVPINSGGSPISSTNTASFATLTSLTDGNTYYYYCRVSSASGEATSGVFTVTVGISPSGLPAGSGIFTGRKCFYIAEGAGNDGQNSCGLLAIRQNRKTDFGLRIEQDAVNPVSAKVAVYYKSSLNSDLENTTRPDAYKIKLYVIYNNNINNAGSNVKLELNISLQDCACCDGLVLEGGAWDYADGNPGDWAVDKNIATGNVNSVVTPNPTSGINSATALNSYFKPEASGALCWYKNSVVGLKSWPDAVTKCASGDYAGDAANEGWYLPNLREWKYLSAYLAVAGNNEATFGGSSDAAPIAIGYHSSSTEYGDSFIYNWGTYLSENSVIGKDGPQIVRCVRRL
jgi:hypothetical protein